MPCTTYILKYFGSFRFYLNIFILWKFHTCTHCINVFWVAIYYVHTFRRCCTICGFMCVLVRGPSASAIFHCDQCFLMSTLLSFPLGNVTNYQLYPLHYSMNVSADPPHPFTSSPASPFYQSHCLMAPQFQPWSARIPPTSTLLIRQALDSFESGLEDKSSLRHFGYVIIVHACSISVRTFKFTIHFTNSLWIPSPIPACNLLTKCVAQVSTIVFCVLSQFIYSCCVLLPHLHCHCDGIFLSVCFFHRSLTSNLPNVNLPNVNLPKVPNLPVNIPLGIPQMPTFSAPSWMAAIYDAECVFSSH